MKNVVEFPRQNPRYDEASLWIARLDKCLSATEQAELRQWMAADPENKAVLLEMTELWDEMSVLSRLSDLFPEPVTQRSKPPVFPFAMAASISVAIAAAWFLFAPNPPVTPEPRQSHVAIDSHSTYETAIGEQSTVSLPDGTQVVLNTNSRVEIEYTEQYRLLRLERGEIHVEVVKDKSRPLSVFVGNQVVQAVGTAFSLEITSEQQIELVVTEGKVLVGVRAYPVDDTTENQPIVLEPSSVMVAAGEEMMLGAPDERIIEVSPAEIEVKLSWREGNLIFKGEPLEDAIAEVGRYTTVEFVILDEDLKIKRVSGLFKSGDVEGLLATLRDNFQVTHRRTADGKILLTRLSLPSPRDITKQGDHCSQDSPNQC